MKYIRIWMLIIWTGMAQAWQLNNISDFEFVGSEEMNIRVRYGQIQTIYTPPVLIKGNTYGHLNNEGMISNECVFEPGSAPVNWDSVIIPVQYAAASDTGGCTVAEPRLCCMEMPDEF